MESPRKICGRGRKSAAVQHCMDEELAGYPARDGMTPSAFDLIGGALADID